MGAVPTREGPGYRTPAPASDALDPNLSVLASTVMTRGALIGPAVLASAVAAFAVPVAATAAGPPAAYQPGIAEYEETLPSAGGGMVAGSSFESHPLPPQIQAKLKREGGTTGVSLRLIASSTMFGAPQTTATPGGPSPLSAQSNGAVASAVDAVRGGVLALVLALVALTVGAAAALPALRRRADAT